MRNKIELLRFLILLILISFAVTAGDCEKILDGGSIPSELVGNWVLIEQTGALQDICADETINFQSSGIAQLTCPNSGTRSRNFSVQNNILTYTETDVSYDIEFINNNLNLYGRNVSRNLKYQRIITDNIPIVYEGITLSKNSSEAGK